MKAVDAGGRLVSQHEYAEAFDFLADARGVATAAVLATVLRAPPASREVPEGLTMLIPVAGLFSISYWLFSHAEAARWQAFIRDKVGRALALGGSGALTVVAFLAVYREGAETALFFQALFAGSADVLVPLACGIAAAAKASPPDSIAPSSRNVPPIAVAPPDTTRHVTTVTLEPNQGKEIKLRMRKGELAPITWTPSQVARPSCATGDFSWVTSKDLGSPPQESSCVSRFEQRDDECAHAPAHELNPRLLPQWPQQPGPPGAPSIGPTASWTPSHPDAPWPAWPS